MTRVLIVAGGTGGHVFPAIAIAEALREMGAETLWLGVGGMETAAVKKHGIPMFVAPCRAPKKMRDYFLLLTAVWRATKIVRQIRPRVALCMGGYPSIAGGIAAKLSGVPLIIHEQNAVAGRANLLLKKFARRVLTGFPDVLDKGEWVGTPVRPAFAVDAVVRYQRAKEVWRLLILGGSQGAAALNKIVPAALAMSPIKASTLHQCGRGNLSTVLENYKQAGIKVLDDSENDSRDDSEIKVLGDSRNVSENDSEIKVPDDSRNVSQDDSSDNDSSNSLTPRRLRGGVEIRASEFPGGGETSSNERIQAMGNNSAPPQKSPGDFYPPPQAAEGESSSAGGENPSAGESSPAMDENSPAAGEMFSGGGESENDDSRGDSQNDSENESQNGSDYDSKKESTVVVREFIDDAAAAMLAADFIICRAGASTLAEIAAAGVAALLVPYPHAVFNHQRENARVFEKRGGAFVCDEKEFTAVWLADFLRGLEVNKLAATGKNAKSLATTTAAKRIAEICLQEAKNAA